MKLLEKKTALITGGSYGIGFAIAQSFASEGADLILVGRDSAALAHAKRKLNQYGVEISTIAADMSEERSSTRIVQQLSLENATLDILVNNAGFGRFIPFSETLPADLAYHFNVNVRAPYLLTQAVVNDLIASKGNVLNISSYFARRMLPDRPSTAYSLTKGALESFTKALAFELGPKGVRVNAIAPGTVATPQVKRNYEALDDQAKTRFNSMVNLIYPLQTTGQPEDIAQMAVFLASEKAAWVTGAIFAVDGGLTTN